MPRLIALPAGLAKQRRGILDQAVWLRYGPHGWGDNDDDRHEEYRDAGIADMPACVGDRGQRPRRAREREGSLCRRPGPHRRDRIERARVAPSRCRAGPGAGAGDRRRRPAGGARRRSRRRERHHRYCRPADRERHPARRRTQARRGCHGRAPLARGRCADPGQDRDHRACLRRRPRHTQPACLRSYAGRLLLGLGRDRGRRRCAARARHPDGRLGRAAPPPSVACGA